MEEPQEPHPGIKLDISMSGAVSMGHNRRSSIVPEQIFRSLRECSRDSYQKIKRSSAVISGPFQYAATPAAPLIQTISSTATSQGHPMDESVCEGPVVACGPSGRGAAMISLLTVPPSLGCISIMSGGKCVDGLKNRAKTLLENIQISVVVRSQTPHERPVQQTLRIKNNKTGHCIYQVTTTSSGEELHPIDSLKHLFPNSKSLRSALTSWNRHFQNPPKHWIINFIPRAYLRRGFFLAEEVCNYLLQNPDGCKYRIEYEPIGHESCLVGNIAPRSLKTRTRNPSRYWEGREKKGVRERLLIES